MAALNCRAESVFHSDFRPRWNRVSLHFHLQLRDSQGLMHNQGRRVWMRWKSFPLAPFFYSSTQLHPKISMVHLFIFLFSFVLVFLLLVYLPLPLFHQHTNCRQFVLTFPCAGFVKAQVVRKGDLECLLPAREKARALNEEEGRGRKKVGKEQGEKMRGKTGKRFWAERRRGVLLSPGT